MCFSHKHSVFNLILIYTPAQALHCLEMYKMPEGYIINMTKAGDYKLHTRHRLLFHSSAEVVDWINIQAEEAEVENYLLC